MHTPLWRLAIITLLAMFISSIYLSNSTSAAPLDTQTAAQHSSMRVIKASYVGVSQPLRSITPIVPDPNAPSALRRLQDRLVMPKTQKVSNGGFDVSIVQDRPVGMSMPAPIANFEGVNNVNGVLPPDTQGDIGYDPATGTKYYVQWVNLSFQIWNVTNPAIPVSVYGPAAGNTLWSGTGTICESNNDGDPITLFDHLANRWLMSQFALGFPNNFHQCIAVSATADPTGAWYLYDFQTSTTMMNDYPKFGIWSDGYYMTVNQYDGSTFGWGGAGVAVFERLAMLNGLLARMIYIDAGAVTLDYGGMLPSDLDGPAPTAGTPNYFMEWDDSTWLGDPADSLRIWEFHTDWTNPTNSTFGANASYDPNYTVATSNVDPDICGFARNCIPQPGTTIRLDAISDRLMYRLQFRDFGTYQTLVSNHTVDSTGTDVAGVHWFELRNVGAGWTLNQNGVYSPDTDNRWMGSAAMDDSGDIALGYSVSSSTTYPSVRYTGRLAADPAGQMTQGETSLIAGSGSQTHSASRWGDYSMMAVDPSDGCTYWYTQEYYGTTSSYGWQTRIGSFKFPSCTSLPTGTLTGTVTDGTNPIAGATVSATGGYTTITNASGVYTMDLLAGTYDVTASKYGFLPSTVNGVSITNGTTTTHNFPLSPAPSHTVSGVVTDATAGWPLYARIDISGYPGSPIFTDPASGAYNVTLVDSSYNFTISAMSGGYADAIELVLVAGDTTQDFTLNANLITCSAPGYVLSVGFSENFDTWPLTGWTIVDNITGGGLTWDSSTTYGDGNYTGGADLAADVNSDANNGVEYDTELITPLINTATLANMNLVYKANFQIYSGSEALDLDISNDGSSTWTNISHWVEDHGSYISTPGETVSVDLTPYAGPNFQLRWRYYTNEIDPWDWYAQVDEVAIGATCNPIPSGGLLVGAVYDANNSTAIVNPGVKDAALNLALLIDNSADASQPHPMYVIGEPAGIVSLTASAPLYVSDTQSPTVVAGDTVRQDFNLLAGNLSTDPISMTFNVTPPAPTDSQPLTLNNTGGAAANYEVFALPSTWSGYAPTGPFADHTRHTGPKNLNDGNASKLRVDLTPLDVPELNAGTISTSWGTGLTSTWGIGFNLDANDLWLGNIALIGGDNLNYRFQTDGTNTGDTIDTSPWVNIFAADMTYNPFTHKLWQVNVGGDNCIYEMDPATMVSTGNKICPAFGTSERGLAFDPLTNTYYAGSWNDGIINHFAPDGTLIDSANVNLGMSGLAFNPSTGHLFVMTNHAHDMASFDVYVLDTQNSYNILGAFNLKNGSSNAFVDYDQAGLEMDCNGNLWAVDQGQQKVYVANSGETGVCDWQATWLSAAPTTGIVSAGGNTTPTTSVDATGMSLGMYQAYLRVVNDTPYGDEIVPVTLNVVNSPPVANDQSVTTAEDTAKAITLTATDADGDALTYTVVTQPSHGTLSGIAPNLTYTPDTNYYGTDSFTYKANDGIDDSNIATVSIIVSVTETYIFLPVINR